MDGCRAVLWFPFLMILEILFTVYFVGLLVLGACIFLGLCSHLDGASFSSLLRKDVCEVIFWRPHIFATVFIVKSHVIDGLVRYRILHGKSFSLRLMKTLLHHLLVSIVAVPKLNTHPILGLYYETCCFSLDIKDLLVFGVLQSHSHPALVWI